MFKQKLFGFTVAVITVLLTFACVKADNNTITNTSSEKQPTPSSLETEVNLSDDPASQEATNEPTKEPDNKVLDNELINTILSKQKELNLCDDVFQEDFLKEMSRVYQIDAQRMLVEIICYGGAYQPGFQYFLVNSDNDIQPVFLTKLDNETGEGEIVQVEETFLTGLPEYDQTKKTLSIFRKYAGHGGCGYEAKYQWQEDSFELLEFKANFDCDNPVYSENWPIIYPVNLDEKEKQ
jgi:hypothetical protein